MLQIPGVGCDDLMIVRTQTDIAGCYDTLGQHELAYPIMARAYAKRVAKVGAAEPATLNLAGNLGRTTLKLKKYAEARDLLGGRVPVAIQVLGKEHHVTIRLRWFYCQAIYKDADATLGEVREAVTMLEDVAITSRRVFGAEHPTARGCQYALDEARLLASIRTD